MRAPVVLSKLAGQQLRVFSIPPSIANTDHIAVLAGIDAWSVNGDSLRSSDLASTLFSFSLLPYLAFLWFLGRNATKTPPLGNFGFQFLLVFVGATIPAGIYAKQHYGNILANVNVLHGLAESLLTVTNLLIIAGFLPHSEPLGKKLVGTMLQRLALLTVATVTVLLFFSGQHPAEPPNALSLPTWAVHTSSILEWLVAMQLVWNYADKADNPRWRGLAWAMVPAHASGLCACTYHVFYNSPAVVQLVALQAALTVVGNSAMAFASYRIWQYEQQRLVETSFAKAPESTLSPSRMTIITNNAGFYGDLFLKAGLLAVIVKYGEVYLPQVWDPQLSVALRFVAVPVLHNTAALALRSTAALEHDSG